jgi:hypothetical protein
MHYITEKIFNGSTWFVTGFYFVSKYLSIETIKSGILFFMGVMLLGLQIHLHIIKIRKEKKNEN